MVSSTANVNNTLDKISSAAAAAKRAGIEIKTEFEGDLFCCVSKENNINSAIDLHELNANTKLNTLLEYIYCVTPAEVALQGAHQ